MKKLSSRDIRFQPREYVLRMRINKEEYFTLKREAQNMALPISTYVRFKLFSKKRKKMHRH